LRGCLVLGLAIVCAIFTAATASADTYKQFVTGLTGWTRQFSLTNPDSWPFIPIPIVATDPNAGTTSGLMPVFLYHDRSGYVRKILAPSINYNTTMGLGLTFRYLAYPSDDTQWWVIGGFQEKINRWVDLYYSTGREHTRWWSLNAHFYWERDPTARFYGLGNDSEENDQTNYTLEELYFQALLGLNLTPDLQLALITQPNYVRIARGAFDSLPYTGTLFPTLKGLDGGSEFTNMLQLVYDTRDSLDIPTRGGRVVLYGALADRALGSSFSYTRFGGDVRHYVPLTPRLILAMHAFLGYTPAGNEMPFWALSSLGGEANQLPFAQPLRGYGEDRFVDNNMTDFNLELRWRVYDVRLFKTEGIVELAPFVEAGKVFHDISVDPFNQLHPVGGMGFRAVIPPYVVGYVDIGYGGDGGAVFTGINYPF
jgi:hypothetical protein